MRLTAATAGGIAYKNGNTGKNHLIAWSDELRAIWKKAAGMRIGEVPLFLARDGAAYTSSGFKASWQRVKLRAGLADIRFRFHDLRRKSGSDADDDAHAQALLGHADPKVTRRHYRAKVTAVRPIGAPSVRQKPKR